MRIKIRSNQDWSYLRALVLGTSTQQFEGKEDQASRCEWVSSRSSLGSYLVSYKPEGDFDSLLYDFCLMDGELPDAGLTYYCSILSPSLHFLGCYLCGTSVTSHQSDANAAEGVSSERRN